MADYCVITTACNKKEIAEKIINSLLEKRLIACAQMNTIESTYWWKDEIAKEPEFIINMRTKKSLFTEVEKEILKIHDYDTCEIMACDIEPGNSKFLKWIDDETK